MVYYSNKFREKTLFATLFTIANTICCNYCMIKVELVKNYLISQSYEIFL